MYEVELLAVGNGAKSGDAIALTLSAGAQVHRVRVDSAEPSRRIGFLARTYRGNLKTFAAGFREDVACHVAAMAEPQAAAA